MCKAGIAEPWHIDNPGIFRTLSGVKPDTYSEPPQSFKICENS